MLTPSNKKIGPSHTKRIIGSLSSLRMVWSVASFRALRVPDPLLHMSNTLRSTDWEWETTSNLWRARNMELQIKFLRICRGELLEPIFQKKKKEIQNVGFGFILGVCSYKTLGCKLMGLFGFLPVNIQVSACMATIRKGMKINYGSWQRELISEFNFSPMVCLPREWKGIGSFRGVSYGSFIFLFPVFYLVVEMRIMGSMDDNWILSDDVKLRFILSYLEKKFPRNYIPLPNWEFALKLLLKSLTSFHIHQPNSRLYLSKFHPC